MTLYLLDFRGTLDTLPSPVEYMGALRDKHPNGCVIIVMSGTHVPQHVAAAADQVWSKEDSFIKPLRDFYREGFREVFVSDDMPIAMRTYERTLRNMGFTVTVVHPDDLITLLATFLTN